MGKCLKCGKKILGNDSEDCNNCNERIQELIQGAMEDDVNDRRIRSSNWYKPQDVNIVKTICDTYNVETIDELVEQKIDMLNDSVQDGFCTECGKQHDSLVETDTFTHECQYCHMHTVSSLFEIIYLYRIAQRAKINRYSLPFQPRNLLH